MADYMNKNTELHHETLLSLLKDINNTYQYISNQLNIPIATICRFRKKYLPEVIRKGIYVKQLNCLTCYKLFTFHEARGRPNRGKYCSKQCYTNWQKSEANRGDKHPSWNPNGKHEKEINALRHSEEWKNWRTKIYTRDNFKCKFCSSSLKLEPHHIYPRRTHPELIFEIENGITLCRKCHIPTIRRELDFVDQCKQLLGQD